MPHPRIHNAMEPEALVQQIGFLPFFSCAIPNFSIEEFTPSRYWFVEGVEGPWEWRMELARRGVVAYGKLFAKKAGLVSREWYPDLAKRLAGFGSGGLKGFDTVITNLQMQTYVTVHSFEYAHDKYGRPYGWGVARYAVTEDVLGSDVTQGAYNRDPEESKARIIQHLGILCPEAFDDDLEKLIR